MVTCNRITSRTFCFDFTRIGTRVTCFPYYEIQVKQTNIYIKDTTLISAYPMLLFGGDITVQHREQVISVDDWIQFKVIILNCFRFKYYVAFGFITRIYLPSAALLRQGNVFTPVCDSVHTPPLGQTPPKDRHPPPLGRPPGRHPTPQGDDHCSGRYASYWNAFLFVF